MKNNSKIKDMAYISLFTALICISAWITVPTVVPFTLQTFGIFLALSVLGGKRGFASILLYTALGAVGLPVFSGFRGGIGALTGVTGGYIFGFVATGLIYYLGEKLFRKKKITQIVFLLLGLIACYAIGTVWFSCVYTGSEVKSILSILSTCVFPFIIPDLIKLFLAFIISLKIRKIV